jgi:hypothetical protein
LNQYYDLGLLSIHHLLKIQMKWKI